MYGQWYITIVRNLGEHVLGNTASDYPFGISNCSFRDSSRISGLLFVANSKMEQKECQGV
jgi:hypothetical protein